MYRNLFSVILVIIVIATIFSGCVEDRESNNRYSSFEHTTPKIKQGMMTYNFTIRTNETSKIIRLWIPYPVSNEYQEVKEYFIDGTYNYSGIYRESEFGNIILYAEWFNPPIFPKLNFSYNITRKERINKDFNVTNDFLPVDVERFLVPTSLGPTDGEVKEIAEEETKDNKTILERAISLYDYLVEHGERDSNLSFCGDGDVCELLKNLRGKCADFSSVFVALSRSIGVPSREIFGTRISKDGDITGSYHCHAEFYLPDYGWIPVDPSDVAKLMLNEDLKLDDEKVINARNYYFGIQSETYVDLSTGRDIILNPPQEGEALNYFMYPYAEIDGEPQDFISQEYLKYIVSFKES